MNGNLRQLLLGAAACLAACAPVVLEMAADASTAVRRSLAPTGRLRVGVAVGPAASATFATRDPASGPPRGVPIDLGAALAAALGVPVEYVEYASSGEVTAAAALDAWDVAFVPVDAERRRLLDFGPDYSLFESTYLVAPDSPITRLEEVDRPGVAVAAIEGTTTARGAARALRQARLVTYASVEEMTAALAGGRADAVALSRASLEGLVPRLPGARILDGSFHVAAVAVAVPKNRPDSLVYVSAFIEQAKASGVVRRALDQAGLEALAVAPPAP